MKLTTLVLLSALFVSNSASARGGAIGGGDVTVYPVFACSAQSLDPTFTSQTASVVVAGEADQNGYIMPGMTLTILLVDASGTTIGYLPTKTLPKDFNPAELQAFQYAQTLPNQPNDLIATLKVTGSNGFLYSASAAYTVEDLRLSKCAYIGSTLSH